MTIKELIDYGKKYIPNHQVEMLIEHFTGYSKMEISLNLNEFIDEKNVEYFKESIEKIKNNYPIQYLIGTTNFYGYDFKVNKNVLIPRFETEELVENTIKYINKYFSNDAKIIDLGCGSGCIGITLKKELPNVSVTCLDISEKALEVAKDNAINLDAKVNFLLGNMLDEVNDKFDVIISNPPYISQNEEIEDIVKYNEPHLALYAEDDGLYFYNKILSECKKNLKNSFLIAFEIGFTQKDRIIDIINKYFDKSINIECKKDLSGKERMIYIYKI